MPTTALQHIQQFCELQNLPTPAAMVGSSEKSAKQLRAILRQVVRNLGEFRWPQQRVLLSWASLAGQDQGALTTIFGSGYLGLVQGSLWNTSRRIQVHGPLSEAVWTALQVLPNAGPEFQYWIAGGRLYISPALAAGETLSAVYITGNSVLASNGVTVKTEISADDDSLLFPDNVVAHAIQYLWRKQKGEAGWEDDYNVYIGLVAKNVVKDSAEKLSLEACPVGARPGIIIPSGSWNV